MTTRRLYPLTFSPSFRDYIWGGRSLETLFGRQLPPGRVAESWEISGHASSPTCVDAGCFLGSTLNEVLDVLGTDLVGTHCADMLERGRFPLLVKLLDAHDDLSVQVHPDDAYARAHESDETGKTEVWYVLHTAPGTELICGLARGATRESLLASMGAQSLPEQLHRMAIAPGDCVFVPAGTIHALLAGTLVAEIQQNSDATYRVYDWGRTGTNGARRPLHISKALDVIDWAQVEPGPVRPTALWDDAGVCVQRLVACAHFTVERVRLERGAAFRGTCDGTTFEIWGCLSGDARVESDAHPVRARAIRFVLLPARLGDYTIRAQVESTLLRVFI